MRKINSIVLLGLAIGLLASCEPPAASSSTPVVCDSTDYVEQLKLTLDYRGKVFTQDGIGEVVLNTHVDGDTSHFYQKLADGTVSRSENIKARYECVNTPESTGSIEDWGYAASDFTKAKTMEAKTIVLSSNRLDYGLPEKDGNDRYLCYVWVSEEENADLEDLRLLNLMLVQEGYSPAQGGAESIYADYFYDADARAQCEGNWVWSNLEDPAVPKGAISTTLQEIMEGYRIHPETEERVEWDWLNPSSNEPLPGDPAGTPEKYRVSFPSTVAYSYSDGGDNAYVYDDFGDGTRYGIYCFAGYKALAPLRHPGWRIQMNGVLTEFYGNLQITDIQYSNLYPGDDYITVLEESDEPYVAPVVTAQDIAGDEYINQVVEIRNLHGIANTYGTYHDEDGDAYTLLCRDEEGNDVHIRVYSDTVRDRDNPYVHIDADNFEDYFCKEGETFNIVGPCVVYQPKNGETVHQIQILKNDDLTFND